MVQLARQKKLPSIFIVIDKEEMQDYVSMNLQHWVKDWSWTLEQSHIFLMLARDMHILREIT